MRQSIFALALLAVLLPWTSLAEAPSTQPLAGIRGGLCLVVGAADTSLAVRLAATSELYVQVIQPDAKLAAEWAAQLGKSDNPGREQLAVRSAAFNADDYGSNLFNLIVIEDAAALGRAQLADLDRILVPEGVVALRAGPKGLADAAKGLGMTAVAVDSFAAAWRKPIRPVEWKPADSLKWRAGHRAHMAVGVTGVVLGQGRYFYRELVEGPDAWPEARTILYARDAYNGRTLWTRQERAGYKEWAINAWAPPGNCMAADEKGRLFLYTADGKFICVDATTGEQKLVLMDSGARPGLATICNSKYVLFNDRVFSADDAKLLWQVSRGTKKTAVFGEQLIESDFAALRIRNLADGKETLKADVQWDAKNAANIFVFGNRILLTEGTRWTRPLRMTALDLATGQKAWSLDLGGVFAKDVKSLDASKVQYTQYEGKLLVYVPSGPTWHVAEGGQQFHFTQINLDTGKVEREDFGDKARGMFGNCCAGDTPRRLGDYVYWWHNSWLNIKTMQRTFPYLVHPGCDLRPVAEYGMIYNYPGRKGGPIQGMTAIGPADISFDHEPGGRALIRHADRPASRPPTSASDWPTFRGGPARGNALAADLGSKLTKAWEKQISVGRAAYGVMSGQRTGLTQATSAYGLVYVADIDGQRVVALDAASGVEKWTFAVGSRVDLPPTIHNGLCLFAAKDGFVYCLDAKTGGLIYRLLGAPRERYIGGQEKLESLWPAVSDVMVAEGIGYASFGLANNVHGGTRNIAFKADTGQLVWAQCHHGEPDLTGYPRPEVTAGLFTSTGGADLFVGHTPLDAATGQARVKAKGEPKGLRLSGDVDDLLGYGNSLSRTNEDRAADVFSDGRAKGRCVAFDDALSVAHVVPYGGIGWAHKTPMHIEAIDKDPKQPLWKTEPIELVVDDMLLSPTRIYCVGHYQRITKPAELWILSRADGKVLNTIPVDGFPSFLGLSAADRRLLIATRQGKLICLTEKTEK